MSENKDAATGVIRYNYVSSTYWYPTADECDTDTLTTQIGAVHDTLDGALSYQMEIIQNLSVPNDTPAELRSIVTMYWDPINNIMRMKYKHDKYMYLIHRINMNGGVNHE